MTRILTTPPVSHIEPLDIESLDPISPQVEAFLRTLEQSDDPEEIAQAAAKLLPKYPLSNLLQKIEDRGLTAKLLTLNPLYQSKTAAYLATLNNPSPGLPSLSPEVSAKMALIHFSDTLTGEHCIDTAIIYAYVAKALSSSAEDALLGREASLVHDIGKGDLPELILQSPIPWSFHEKLWEFHNGRPRQEHEDARDVPLDLVIDISLRIFRSQDLPAGLTALFNQRDHDTTHRIKQSLQRQAPKYSDPQALEWLLRRFQISKKQTFLDALAIHEQSAGKLLPQRHTCVVCQHHRYHARPEEILHPLAETLTFTDIIAACSQDRPYFEGARAKTITEISRILEFYASLEKFDPKHLELTRSLFTAPHSSNTPTLRHLITQGEKHFT